MCAFSLRLVVERIPAVLQTTARDFRLTSVAGAALAAMNLRGEDYLGVSLLDFSVHLGPDATPIEAHRRAVHGKGSTFDIELMGRDLQAHIEPLRSRKGDIERTFPSVDLYKVITAYHMPYFSGRDSCYVN